MHKYKKNNPSRLWEWHAPNNPSPASTRASFSYPEDVEKSGSTLIPVVGKTYDHESVVIDGRNFINCEFCECKIQWNGNDFIFTSCTFHGSQNLVSSVPVIAGAMHLAGVCGLLNETTVDSGTDTGCDSGRK